MARLPGAAWWVPPKVATRVALRLRAAERAATGSAVTGPASIYCATDCVYTLAAGTVTLTATGAGDQELDHWSGACAGTHETCTLVLAPAAVVDVRAKFTREHH